MLSISILCNTHKTDTSLTNNTSAREFYCANTSLSHAPQYERIASPTWHLNTTAVHPEHESKRKLKITQTCHVEVYNAPYNPTLRKPCTFMIYGKYNYMMHVVPHVKHVVISLRRVQVSVLPFSFLTRASSHFIQCRSIYMVGCFGNASINDRML